MPNFPVAGRAGSADYDRRKYNEKYGNGLDVSALGYGAMTPDQVANQDPGTPKLQGPQHRDGPKGPSFNDRYADSFYGQNYKGINAGMDAVGNLVGSFGKDTSQGPNGDLRAGIDQGWDSLADTAANFGPYGQIAAGAMKAVGALNKIQGAIFGATDNMTTTDAILDSPLGVLTGVGWINQAFGQKSNTITKDAEAFEQVGSSYGGTGNVVDDALSKSGKKYGAFSASARDAANQEIANARQQQSIMSNIAGNASDRFAIRNSMSAINGNSRAFGLQGGYNQAAIRAGKHGLSLKNIYTAKRLISSLKFKEGSKVYSIVSELSLQDIPEEYLEPLSTVEEVNSVLPEFREGGKVNVIPEGALHARLHHMENAENLTKKGIPVVAEKEGGELEQQAEIEREEVILRLEVTKKLEELQKDYYNDDYTQKQKDEFAIEAGKLITYELLQNTVDNTGLLNEIQ